MWGQAVRLFIVSLFNFGMPACVRLLKVSVELVHGLGLAPLLQLKAACYGVLSKGMHSTRDVISIGVQHGHVRRTLDLPFFFSNVW